MCLAAITQTTHVQEENLRALEEAKDLKQAAERQTKTFQEELARLESENAVLKHKLTMTKSMAASDASVTPRLLHQHESLAKATTERDEALARKHELETEYDQITHALCDLKTRLAQQTEETAQYLKVIRLYERHLQGCSPQLIVDLDDAPMLREVQPGDLQESGGGEKRHHHAGRTVTGSFLNSPTVRGFKISSLFSRGGTASRSNNARQGTKEETVVARKRSKSGAPFTLSPRNCSPSNVSTSEPIAPRPTGTRISNTTLTED